MENFSGQVIKGYELRERIGAGGFGAVYRAQQSTVGREVAVKIILPHFSNHPDFIRRFETEAHLIARLEHLHIVPLYDYWRDTDGAYLVMRWLRGGSLRDLLKSGALELMTAASIIDQIAAALSAAHRSSIIHRDLKPANILLDEDNNAYLADFGIAKDVSLQRGITEVDAIVGSPDYLAPEQARAEPVTPATDIYSLGVVLYELLSGEHPFPNLNPIEQLFKHLNEPLPDINTLPVSIAADINAVIQKATAKDPQHRFTDALHMAAAFRQAIHSAPANLVETLTPREQEILQRIIEGRSNKQIADELFVTVMTVKWYITQIYRKLGVRNRVQAIVRARELNLITSKPGELRIVTIPSSDDIDVPNPYKGLRAFQAADHQDFYGREKVIDKLLKRLETPAPGSSHSVGKIDSDAFYRFLAVVGPSGSGKSSLVKAGLIPALWRGALPGSEKWFIVEMLPGTHPIDELEVALTRVAASGNLNEQLARDKRGLVRAAGMILPEDGSELVLVIDQFEEVFTLVEDEVERAHFLDLLHAAVTEPRSRVRVIVTLRADFYDRPLHYPQIGELIRSRMETVLPMSAEELERAIARPAERIGAAFEPGLVASIVSEINYQPGALPLLQYALTELFEQRKGRMLTREAYDAIGRTIGALAKRADELYLGLDDVGKDAAKQMFLRLVTLGEGVEDTRRRVTRSELLAITREPEIMDEVIDLFAEYRLLSLDNDPGTRAPTVEVAHEAILREWERLRNWLSDSRDEIKLQRQLASMAAEWRESKQDASFLARGSRLEQFEKWSADTTLALTPAEHTYLEASIVQRDIEAKAETERQAHVKALEGRSVTFLRGLVAVLILATLGAFGLTGFAFSERASAQAERDIARELALINGVQAALATGNTDLAIMLAFEANRSANPSPQAQLLLSQAAYTPGTVRRFTEHTLRVLDVAFSPDGHIAASCSEDNTIYLWDTSTGAMLHHLQGHSDDVDAVAFSPDGRTLLSASGDTALILWDVETGERIRTFRRHTAWVNDVTFSADGQTALSGADDRSMILWDVATGEPIQRFVGHTDWVNSVALHPDGQRVLSGSKDGTMILWDIETGDIIRRYQGNIGELTAARFSSDGRTILMGGASSEIVVWNTESGVVIRHLQGHNSFVMSLEVSSDGRFALSGAWDATMILWETETGEMLHQFQGHIGVVSGVALSPDGTQALSSSYDTTARLWDLQGGQIARRFPENGQPLDWILYTHISPDGRYGLTSSEDGISVLWDIQTGIEFRRFEGHSAIFSSDSNILIIGTGGPSGSGSVVFLNLATGQEIRRFEFSRAGVINVAYAPDREMLLVSLSDETRELIDATTGESLRRFTNVRGSTISVAFNGDESIIAIGANDGTVLVFDVNTYRILHELVGHTDFIFDVTFSSDGTTLLTSSLDNTIILWDVATGNIVRRFTDHSAAVFAAAYSPDGQFIVSSSADRTFIIRDSQTGEIVRRFTDLHDGIFSAAFSPDGNQLLVGYVDGTVELWRMDTPESLLNWITANRYIPNFTCDQRELYRIEPLCEESSVFP